MNIQKLRKIIDFNHTNRELIQGKVDCFYTRARLSKEQDILNMMQIVRNMIFDKGYLILELPFIDHEIGAMCYNGDALGYVLLNTSLPKVNVNFALCHELYHILEKNHLQKVKLQLTNENYYEYEEEYEANLFASMILMPERSFRMMYHKFADENNSINKENSIYDRIILKLMNYYQVPYMAVLIRCFELELGEWNVQRLLEEANSNTIQEKFEALWLDKELLEATGKDDFSRIEGMVKKFGDEAVNGTFMNEAAVERALQNMRALYLEIRGE